MSLMSSLKIISVVGARPEFIQATPVSRALRKHHHEILVHTGQHYDYKMSQTFFDELGIPAPDYNLEVGSGSHAGQTAEILVSFEKVVQQEQPDVVLVRGDTNSTLAGALVASKLHIPVVHVEAGERSFDRRMPEEINRLVADQLSSAYFCVSQTAVRQLAAEGIARNVFWVKNPRFFPRSGLFLENTPWSPSTERPTPMTPPASRTLSKP
jgi:UDP-N-acetylglucosamine 2-epimerase